MITIAVFSIGVAGCEFGTAAPPKSSTGVTQAQAKVKTQADGLTVEQGNIKRKVELENAPGAIKHMYVVSAMSGDVLIYSTIKGKVTSSGKRLTPYSVVATDGQYVDSSSRGVKVNIGGKNHYTPEVLQDDGTYGSSISYLYWWDARGIYHKQYVAGGIMIHITDQPMNFPKIILNLEEAA
jgi:hypothetical protein